MIGPIDIGYPPRDLSPNGRAHHMALHRAKKKQLEEAYWATKVVLPRDWEHNGLPLTIAIAWHPVAGKAAPDRDNALASLKGALDGIAKALGVDDKLFRPVLTVADHKPAGAVSFNIIPETL